MAQRDAVFRAYAYVAGDARTFLEDYFSAPENDPRLLAAELRRSVDVVSVLPVPVPDGSASRTYRARWNEHEVSGRSGTRDRVWEGYFSVEVQPPTSTEGIERNPLGVFVTDVSWSALAGELPPGSASRGPAPTVPDATPDTVGTDAAAQRPSPD